MSPARRARDRRRTAAPDAGADAGAPDGGTAADPAASPTEPTGRSAARAGRRDRGAAWRLPAVVLVVGALVAGVSLAGRWRVADPPEASGLVPSRYAPVAPPAEAPSSTWFCAGGTARGSEGRPPAGAADARTAVVAEHRITIANAATAPRNVRVTAFVPAPTAATPGSTAPGTTARTPGTTAPATAGAAAPVTRDLRVEAGSRTEVALSDLVTAPWASALVEADGGLVAVEHTVQGPTGRSSAPCASSSSAAWYFPSGATRLGTRTVFVVFNPFPDAANVDFSFETDQVANPPATGGTTAGTTPGATRPAGTTPPGTAGTSRSRESERFKGLVVPPQSTLAVDITDVITVRGQIATTVEARAGRVVIDEVVASEAAGGSPAGLSLVPGAARTAPAWLFAAAPGPSQDLDQQYVVFNPGTEEADVTLTVTPDLGGAEGVVEPYDVKVRPGSYQVVSLAQDNRVPAGVGGWVAVRSNGPGVVVDRVVRATGKGTTGTITTLGSPILARSWLVPSVAQGTAGGEVAVANPSAAEPVTLTVTGFRDGVERPLPNLDGVAVAPGDRAVVDLNALGGEPPDLLRVQASGAVVVERRAAGTSGGFLTDSMALAVDGTASFPPADLYDRAAAGDLGPGTSLTPETVIGGTVPGAPEGGSIPGTGSVPLDSLPTDSLPAASLPGEPPTTPGAGPTPTTTLPGGPAAGVTTTTAAVPPAGAGPGE